MQAIVTKYLGPTNRRGARVKATSASGQSVTIPYSSELPDELAHRQAAEALCRKLKWDNVQKLVSGGLKSGFAFVFCP